MKNLKTVDVEDPTKRRPLHRTGLGLIALSFQTLGIIYSDIGTSPLYVLNGIWSPSGPAPSKEDVIGGISCIIWGLTILPLLKYVFVALRFGTEEGEGGCFALYHGLYPPAAPTNLEEDRSLTGDSFKENPGPRTPTLLQRFKWVLLPWTLFGTSLTMADGIFTPAVSVTSAVGGIAVAKPSVSANVIPISIAFLIALFAIQRFGTAKLSFAFSPITFVWLLFLAGTGIANITHFPGIFRAFDPSRAVLLFVRTRDYDLLAGVLLALTGCEALFANLGQFNMLSIQISFTLVTYPALLLAYLGQGARLIVDGEAVLSNVFYDTIPGPHNGALFWIMYVLAILATLVASQALITATFSLIQQLMHMKSFPQLRTHHTSDTIEGQIYIPAVNWTLGALTLIVVGAFSSATALTNAYGFAVASVMFVTTTLIAIQCYYVKRLHWTIALVLFLFFGFFDGLFFGAALKKVPEGAWVPLLIGGILLIIMLFWTWARGLEEVFDGANRRNLRHFILSKRHEDDDRNENLDAPITKAATNDTDSSMSTSRNAISKNVFSMAADNGTTEPLASLPILAVFHKFTTGRGIPHTFVGFIRQYPALPRVVVFLSVKVVSIARVPPQDRLIVDKVRSLDGFYGVTYQLGYREDFDIDVSAIVKNICEIERGAKGNDAEAAIREILDASKRTTHIIPHYHVVSKTVTVIRNFKFANAVVNWLREILLEVFYGRLVTMFPETANWLTRADEMIHVGITARI